jgi:hypothetical protein
MLSITPCRGTISDRFPVASFVVNVPPHRVFEIACATDPQLFRGERRGQRTTENFFSSRGGGLLRAPAGQATYLLPPDQLRRFAGQRRLYYSMASFGDTNGAAPEFTVGPQEVERAPYLALSPDFTGRSLDRSRLGRPPPAEPRYGNGAATALTWGGDFAAIGSPAPQEAPRPPVYDDGYPADLWSRAQARDPDDSPDPADPPDPEPTAALGEPPGYEDAPALRAAEEVAAYGRRSYGGFAARAQPAAAPAVVEPPGLEHPPPLSAPTYGRGRSETAEPPGAADPADLQGHRPASAYASTLQPLGAEGARGPRQRYGDASGAAAPAPSTAPPAQAFSPPGVDDRYDDLLVPDPEGELSSALLAAEGTLSILEKFRLAQPAAQFESGPAGYEAINADGEFNDPTHAAYQRKHYGLHWGILQFNQRSGALGRVLVACERRNPAKFREAFGPERDRLLRVTTAEDEESRLQPVGGTLVWQEPWLSRFRAAGRIPEFQAAQNEVAIEGYFDPNLAFASALGFDTDRALAMLYDRVVDLGNRGGRSFVIDAVTPLKDAAAIASALRAIGHDSPQSFQRSLGLAESPALGAKAHAALLQALRAAKSSPVPVPDLPHMQDALVAASRGRRFEQRVSSLRTSTQLSDVRRQVS